MTVTTCNGNVYSYIRRTNKIVGGLVEEKNFVWTFEPLKPFSLMAEVNMFIIGITEQCNLRCSYCCYSGEYVNNRSHGNKSLTSDDIDEIYDFMQKTSGKRPLLVAFYGGEPLLQFPLIKQMVAKGKERFGDEVRFSITTNATLLTPDVIDWAFSCQIELTISIDGTKEFHDKHRIFANGAGSFDKVRNALTYIKSNYQHLLKLLSIQMTLTSFRNIVKIAESWNEDDVLRDFTPSMIHGVSPNFSTGVKKSVYEEERSFYVSLLDVFEHHQDWGVLGVVLNECIDDWKNRPILEVVGPVPMPTCMPVNTKLYIDASKEIGVCEKVADKYRIGSVEKGIDWDKANEMVKDFYAKRTKRCRLCPVVRVCDICLTSIGYSDEQLDVICHNERVYAQVSMFLFCEMAERGLIK